MNEEQKEREERSKQAGTPVVDPPQSEEDERRERDRMLHVLSKGLKKCSERARGFLLQYVKGGGPQSEETLRFRAAYEAACLVKVEMEVIGLRSGFGFSEIARWEANVAHNRANMLGRFEAEIMAEEQDRPQIITEAPAGFDPRRQGG